MKSSKIVVKTLGRVILVFAKDEKHLWRDFDHDLDNNVPYNGPVEQITEEVAATVAPFHPSFFQYMEDALATLYVGKGIYSKGTEDPVRAIQSYAPSDYKWMVIIKY